MGQAATRIQRRNEAKALLSRLMQRPDKVIVIHYSCESFYDRSDGSSPRITSVAVRNLESSQAMSFSIQQMAERSRYTPDQLELHYDELETSMLTEFYEFVRSHHDHYWVHWNMRDVNYGFQALSHRYRVLGGNPHIPREDLLVDLSASLKDIFGSSYIDHPRLKSLTELNNIDHRDFLLGADEAKAFQNREYVKLHQSTLRKVQVIAQLARRASEGTLKTRANWKEMYGTYPDALAEFILERWYFVLLGFLSSVAGAVLSVIALVHK